MKKFYEGSSGVIGQRNETVSTLQADTSDIRAVRAGGERGAVEGMKVIQNQERQILTTGESLMLRDVREYPMSCMTERYERIGVSGYKGNKLKDALIGKGLVVMESVSTGQGRVEIMRMTERGKEFVDEERGEKRGEGRQGGIDHEYWKEQAGRDTVLNGRRRSAAARRLTWRFGEGGRALP